MQYLSDVKTFFFVAALLFGIRIGVWFILSQFPMKMGDLLTYKLVGFIDHYQVLFQQIPEAKKNAYFRTFLPSIVVSTGASIIIGYLLVLASNKILGFQLLIPITGTVLFLYFSSYIKWVKNDIEEMPLNTEYWIQPKTLFKSLIYFLSAYVLIVVAKLFLPEIVFGFITIFAAVVSFTGFALAISQLTLFTHLESTAAQALFCFAILNIFLIQSGWAIYRTKNSAGVMLAVILGLAGAFYYSLYSLFI